MEGKGKPDAEFKDDEWMCEYAFIVNRSTHLNEENISKAELT
jgi:hypothetical protein